MVTGKSAGYSHLGDPNRENSSHAPARIDVERNATPPVPSSSSNGSGFDIRTTKPITSSTFQHEKVFPFIQRCKYEIESTLDTAFTFEALTNADLDWKYVKPLANKLTKGGKKKPPACLVYALLVARVYFLDKAEDDLAYAGVNTARADLCEILSIKMLSVYGSHSSTSNEHLYVLTAPFNPFAGATIDMFTTNEINSETLQEMIQDGKEDATNALELSISSQARRFVKSPLVQHVVKAIFEGDVMYSLESNHSLITDNYKSNPVVAIYDWRSRPFLDHYRLKVPYVRKTLELIAFASVFLLFLLTEGTYNLEHLNLPEVLFIIWSIGFALDEFASLYENGLSTYFYGAFNVLDSLFCAVFFVYLGMRGTALSNGEPALSQLAFDVLSLSGCVLAPRLMVSLIPDHVVVMALGRMARQFALFMVLAFLTASGFLVTFHILARGSWSLRQISWLMLRIWLSGAFLGFDAAQQFHPVFGPILMVAFAVLSQTLLLTILISSLSNTFAQVQTDADTEIANQLAVRTMERVKSDPLSSYTTPFNIIAFSILFPLRFVASPRILHRAQAFLARLLNLPVLLFLAIRIRLLQRSTKLKRQALSASVTPNGSFISQTARGAQKALERLTENWEEGGEALRKVFEFEVNERAYKSEEEEEAKKEEENEQRKVKEKEKERKKGWDYILGGTSKSGKKSKEVEEDDKGEKKGIEDRLASIEDALEILLTEMVRNRRSTDGKVEGTSSNEM